MTTTWDAATLSDEPADLWGKAPVGGWGAPLLEEWTVRLRRPVRLMAQRTAHPRPADNNDPWAAPQRPGRAGRPPAGRGSGAPAARVRSAARHPAGAPSSARSVRGVPVSGTRHPVRRQSRSAPLAGVGAVAAAAAVLAFWMPGYLVTHVLDDAALARGVAGVLVDEYDLAARDVSCPAGVEAVAEATFTCSAIVDAGRVEVPVRILDRDGTYEVGRPR